FSADDSCSIALARSNQVSLPSDSYSECRRMVGDSTTSPAFSSLSCGPHLSADVETSLLKYFPPVKQINQVNNQNNHHHQLQHKRATLMKLIDHESIKFLRRLQFLCH